MPVINGRYYMNPQYGAALEAARLADAARSQAAQPQSPPQNSAGNASLSDRVVNALKGPPPPPPPLPPSLQPPPVPKPPAVYTPGTPQYKLSQAQDEVRNDPRLAAYGDTTYCNIATYRTVQTMGGPLDDLTSNGQPVLANDAYARLAHSDEWRETTPEDAQQAADEGKVVIGVQKNPGGHGHMVTVRPEPLPGLSQQLGIAPLVNNVGRYQNVVSGSAAFMKGLPVYYYTPSDDDAP